MRKRLAIATRDGEPAYLNAPERKRQSHFPRPETPMDYEPRPGLWARIFGRVR